MAGMPLRKYIKIDLSILDNTSWAGAAGIGHRDDVSSWLRAISAGNNLHYTGAQKKQAACGQLRMNVDTNHRNQDEGAPPVFCPQCVARALYAVMQI